MDITDHIGREKEKLGVSIYIRCIYCKSKCVSDGTCINLVPLTCIYVSQLYSDTCLKTVASRQVSLQLYSFNGFNSILPAHVLPCFLHYLYLLLGSVHVNFTVSGMEEDMVPALDAIAADIVDGDAIRYHETYFNYSGLMLVDGEVYNGMTPKPVVCR